MEIQATFGALTHPAVPNVHTHVWGVPRLRAEATATQEETKNETYSVSNKMYNFFKSKSSDTTVGVVVIAVKRHAAAAVDTTFCDNFLQLSVNLGKLNWREMFAKTN